MIGTTLSHFKITSKLGEGGMGEVWRAIDEKLGREVALKVLPEEFAKDPERMARFEREAKVLASLNHPNIATLYGLETAVPSGTETETETGTGPTTFLAMELVEGEDLSERIKSGPVPIDEAIPIARQIAEALEAAHDAGIVHRDLKPANIKLTEDGVIKVLDFGLAKAWESDHGDSSLSLSPTVTRHATVDGVILGTAAYMSPEQARGRRVDRRADLWSFGVVLWEMLTARKLFEGETVSDIVAAVLTREPDFEELPVGTPFQVRELIARCVERDAKQRLQAAGEARIALSGTAPSGLEEERIDTDERTPRHHRFFRWAAVAAGVLAVGATFGWWRAATLRQPVTEATWTFSPVTRLPGLEIQPSLSSDGRYVVYASNIDGDWDIYFLRLGGDNPINLTADHDGDDVSPVFSPDGERIAFRSDRDGGGLFIMGATGESVRRTTDTGFNPSWSPDGRKLVFADEAVDYRPTSRIITSQLRTVNVETGEVFLIPGIHDAVQPAWSPDGEWIAFWGLPEETGQRDLWMVHPDGSDLISVTSDPALDWNPSWSPDGSRLFFSSDRGGTLGPWWVAIDGRKGRVVGVPRPLTVPSTWAGDIDVGIDGTTIVYSNADFRANIFRVDLDPETLRVIGEPVPVTRGASKYVQISPSPDGQWVAATAVGAQETLTLIRTDGASIRRLTDDAFHNRGPVWSPDGDLLAFYSDRSGGYQAHTIRPDGSDLEQVTDIEGGVVLPFWSPDGTRLLASSMEGNTMVIHLDGTRPITEMTRVPRLERAGVDQPSSWTSDGQGVVIATREDDQDATSLYIVDLESGQIQVVAEKRLRVDFHYGLPVALDDGRHLMFSDGEGIVVLDIETGGTRTLLKNPLGSEYAAPRMGPGQRSLYFTNLEEEADLWIAKKEDPSKIE
jgi:Tol biopolymer transport system component